MVAASFAHVKVWVFDLDNTLYPPEARLFDQIERKMNAYVIRELGVPPEEADRLRADYWRAHGTTLAGLMAEHGVDPDPYLAEVHDIDVSGLSPDPALAAAIRALPGRRIVYTNGSRPYAEQVLAARGLAGCFDAVYGVEHAGYRPKPEQAAFEAVFALDGIAPAEAAMFEDVPRNLAVPHALGMRTVHVAPEPLPPDLAAEHIHHHTSDLTAFLQALAPGVAPA
ncbi:pyrimidine 5'-nucleotidase [Pseudoroseicyclus tamaricis]|uniref:Pyrimidine 5'-nucleotidase n=1 Tax=Pseudoroseicyclus tamaricis TaxID=2705421 RepID=A0A6B2K5H8_9RHOB|nr:pyrimidine 5'-nucleotidase [Pseudoroseicyclus tamaricis]NDV02026.1 pyrimidine 5'-nucleotidase [Pseudoroseicyclus tamaricis]